MKNHSTPFTNPPPAEEAIQANCVHVSGEINKFPIEDVETSIPERFEEIVRMYRDRIAVKTGREVVTYSELNVMANRVAHAIISRRGTKAEAVAILLDKGVRLMAAMLAVLKAGKFFVLLDTLSPKARLAAVLGDSQAGLIISDREYGEVTRHFISADSNLLEFDSIASQFAAENINLRMSPNSLAAIMYTSGSTGESKGVIWAHRNLLHQVMLFTNAYKLSECDRVSLTTSGTGNAVTIGFLPLLNGATLLAFDVQSHGIKALVKWILQEKISICWFGSPLFRNICGVLTGEEQFPDVRILRLASEASYKSDFELYKQHFSPECILINGLSNTESGLICVYPANFKTEILGQEVPVGYPVEDKEVLLLDDAGREVGANEVGQIAVRSRYLSPGYWHRPELTANNFKPDPKGGDQRVYFSGDLGLMLPDGCLIHKGRKDFRVKIRGYGVEIAEIEKVLNTHAAVGQAVVVARKKETGEAQLVAYYTCTGLPTPTVSELRGFLGNQLPHFMIPSTFVRLDTIPLTHSGKTDRRALPDPDNVRPELATPYLSPRNEIEQKLVAIWEGVLDVCPVGVNDGFFDLGGDSLSATRVISQIIKHFQLEIPLQSLFQSPTIADMALVVAQQRGTLPGNYNQDHLAGARLVPVSREGILPLSYSQQRLWFLDQLDPGSFTYNVFSAYRLKGELNVAALEQSFNEILRRHEVLRTVFKSEGGNPVQVVLPVLAIKIPVFDLRGTVSELDRRTEVRRMAKEEAQRPFDLATGPLLRMTLLRLADEEYVFLRAMHHIVADAWSAGVLFRELAALYEAFLNGRPSPLADLPIQYADYAAWQRQWLQGEILESQLSYWKKQLGNIPTLRLPTDRPRPAVQPPRGARHYFTLSDTLSSELKSLSRRQRVTVFMTLLAAFQTLLSLHSGQTDIVIGSPVAGRNRSEFERLIGFFLNMLVLRTDLSGDPTFGEAMTRVRDMCLGALSHQELPFEKLVEELHPERDLSQNPLFQATFAFQNTPRFLPRLSNITADQLEVDSGIARFDLDLFMEEIDGSLKGHWDYDTNLFNADTIERMIGHFQTLLGSVVYKPDQRITDIPILTEAEKHQLLVEWNNTKQDYPEDKSIQELFEEQVERSPDAVAVIFEDQQLTYRELNTRANQLAYYLRKRGAGPETLIGICMERSLEMIVGLLGILKAGGAYVPLDPEYPKERLAFMLDDSRSQIVVTKESLVTRLPETQGQVLCLDTDWNRISNQTVTNPPLSTSSRSLAYVIYTSGSTGQPKGVLVSHGSIVDHCRTAQRYYELDASDGVLQFASLSFDVSLEEILPTFIVGAKLVVMGPDMWHPAEFHRKISEFGLTVVNLPSAYWQELARQWAGVPELVPNIQPRLFIVGGDTMPPDGLDLWQRTPLNSVRLLNAYGPTETTITATAFEFSPRLCENRTFQRIPIGRPLANREIYILDNYGNPVPVGVPGELHIGGVGVGRGYLNRPELTAEKFIPNPFSNEPGARLYRTGDLARYLPDGNIEFLGRMDHQVKIRGFRIELGEIESALSQHPSLREVVVLAREEVPGDPSASFGTSKRLVAYVVFSKDPACTTSELRNFLKQKLPEYMVPSSFVVLDSLPLTPNGKIDRKALPVPDQSRPELEQACVAPRTPVEELLAGIWAEVLKLEKVGVLDNFFDLGGHSLVAAQLVSRIRDAFRIELPLRRLFEGPTVAGVAKHIELARQDTAGLKALPIVPEAFDGEWPLSFAQERFWFLEQLEPNNVAYHVTYVFRLIGPLNIEALDKAIAEIVRRHETLRTTFQVRNGKPVQVISEQWSSPLKIIDLSQHPPATREAELPGILESERRCVFDLARDLLLRATLLQLGTDEHVLVLNSHHIAWDLWSIGILFREFAALYRAYVAGQPSLLPDPTIQYKHYALWQRNVFDRAGLQHHLTYWKEQLRGAPQSLNLPTDHARKPLGNRRGGRERLILSKSLSDGLRTLSREAGVTLFMTFLAAYQALLHRMTGQDDIVVGTPVATRDRLETERVIGIFLNTLALRTNLSGNPIFFDLLRRVWEISLRAYEHQDFPFEKLVEELQPKRDLTRTPIFQVFISMYNFKENTLELDGLSVSHLRLTMSHALFDMSLLILEQNDGTNLIFQYDADLFEHSTIVRTVGYFHTLLEGIVAHPDHRISDLPILTEAERHQLLVEWNDTKRDYPKDTCIHELFEEQAEKTPDAIAVVFEEQQLAYRELNTRANQLAYYLRKLGVRPEVPVAICMERSIEMVVGLLAVLKAGGAYVPLDPSYPKERLGFMLEDTHTGIVLSDTASRNSLPPASARVICLDRDWEELAREPQVNPISQSTADSVAYVIYTSGSTGVPKGVEVRHRGVVRLLFGVDYVQLDTTRTFLHLAPISFDAATFEVWGALLHGGKCILFAGKVPSAKELGELLKKHQVTTSWLTAALFNTVIDEEPQALADVKQLVIGGEALSVPHVRKGIALLPNTEIINGYGPTESTTFTCCYPISRQLDDHLSSIPIGKPIGNTQVYILDSHLNPVPIGVPGELHIGGDGLARGYLNRPELTQEKFIPDPFSTDLASRLYKTGDLARYLPDGNIEFLGRMDNQVKIRGYRIELGEIEAVLAQHPGVREAIVLAREDKPGDPSTGLGTGKQLAAYIVPKESAPATSELRAYLKAKLPDYMVPSAFVIRDCLPLTPNGKVDRKALASLAGDDFESAPVYIAPRNAAEEIIARIWAEILGRKRIGIQDNFFDLGGHSLKATQVVSRLRKAFRSEIPLRHMFEFPTIAELANAISGSEDQQTANPKDIDLLLTEIEAMSEEEAQKLLSQKTAARGRD